MRAARPVQPRSRLAKFRRVFATEMHITPTRLTPMARAAATLTASPRITTPKTAACTVSVFE